MATSARRNGSVQVLIVRQRFASTDASRPCCFLASSVFARPFILSVLSPLPTSLIPLNSTSPALSALSSVPTIQIRSSETLTSLQTFSLPSTTSPHTVHHLTPSSASSQMLKPPLYFVSTPTERAALAAEGGSKMWCLRMKEVGEVVDELTLQGEYQESLAILKGVDERSLNDKVRRCDLASTFFDRRISLRTDGIRCFRSLRPLGRPSYRPSMLSHSSTLPLPPPHLKRPSRLSSLSPSTLPKSSLSSPRSSAVVSRFPRRTGSSCLEARPNSGLRRRRMQRLHLRIRTGGRTTREERSARRG